MHARPLTSFAVCYLLGLIAAFNFRLLFLPCILLCLLALTGYIIIRIHGRRQAAVLMLFALLLGMGRMAFSLENFPQFETRYSANIVGKIVSEPYTNPETGRVISRFHLESIDGEAADMTVRLYLRGDEAALSAIDYGQHLSATAHIWKSDPVTNPYEFDFDLYLQREGTPAFATAKIEDVQILDGERDIQSVFIGIRRGMSHRIDRLFPDNSGLVHALILGDRTQLSEDMRQSLNETGIAHLISISGMHVTTLAMLVSFLLTLFLSRKASVSVTLIFLLFYGGLIGFSASFVRALVMFAVFSFAPFAGYPSDGITRLCTAMLITLIFKPLNILDAGFVLSYASAAGIILLTPPLNNLMGITPLLHLKPLPNPFLQWLRNGLIYFPKLICASIAAQLVSLPAVIAYFGVQSVISAPINLVCVPLCMIGFPLAIGALIISIVFMPLAAFVSSCADNLFSCLIFTAAWGASLPITVIRIGRYSAPLVLVHSAIIFASSNLSLIKERYRKFIPMALILVAGFASLLTHSQSLGFSITFLDADQADCAVIRTQGHTYLVDTGDTYTPAADYLSATCLHLDGIFLSHPHQDHAGGLEDILAIFKPDAIYIPAGWYEQENISQAVLDGMAIAEKMNIPIEELSVGDELSLSRDTTSTIYSPDKDNLPDSANDISLLMAITHRDKTALFTGDLSMNGEPDIIPDADILKLAHHGSDKATSAVFLERTAPEIAVISVGENNFEHPADITLKKLDNVHAQVLRTDHCGAITLRLKSDDTWQIKTYLPQEEYNDLE